LSIGAKPPQRYSSRVLGRVALSLIAAGVVAPTAARAKPDPVELSEAQVDAVVRAHLGEIPRCRPKVGRGASPLVGRIDAGFAISWMGRVRAVTINEDTIGAPALRDCIAETMLRWSFPRSQPGDETEDELFFVFDEHGVKLAGSATVPPKLAEADAPRVFLLRYGGRFVPLACVARGRSFLARVCNDRIAYQPNLGVSPGYLSNDRILRVAPGYVRDEWDEIDVSGFVSTGWPGAPPGAKPRFASPGPEDGFATWPASSFVVTPSPYGQDALQAGMSDRCKDEPWLACSEANLRSPPAWDELHPGEGTPGLRGPLAEEARRLLAPLGRRWKKTSPPRLIQTFSLDLDGDGVPELLHNVVLADLDEREVSPGHFPHDSPGAMYFIFVERRGHLARVPVHTAASHVDKMDGLVMGWMDLDGDGRPEVWMETPRNHGHTTQLVRFEGGAFRPVAELGYTYYGDAREE
jgi:hypothetical protein